MLGPEQVHIVGERGLYTVLNPGVKRRKQVGSVISAEKGVTVILTWGASILWKIQSPSSNIPPCKFHVLHSAHPRRDDILMVTFLLLFR